MQTLLVTLGITLILLKLLGIIHLGWVWVLAPLWVPIVLGVAVMAIIMSLALIYKN